MRGRGRARRFQVDLPALHAAADGIRGTLEQVSAQSIGPVGTAAGHARLGSTLDDFGERWRVGVASLAEDGQALADRLSQAEMTNSKGSARRGAR